MRRTSILGWLLAAAAIGAPEVSTQGAAGVSQTMPNLTIPQERLGPDCQLAPESLATPDGLKRRVWTLQVSDNPWRGTDRALLSAIRARMFGSPVVPDGPPLGAAEARRFMLRMADGVDEGYVAFYQQAGSPTVTVYGLRFSDEASMPGTRKRDPHLVKAGTSFAYVSGGAGPCLELAKAQLRSLGQ